MARKPKGPKRVETLTHDEAKRKNIPTAELQSTAERAAGVLSGLETFGKYRIN